MSYTLLEEWARFAGKRVHKTHQIYAEAFYRPDAEYQQLRIEARTKKAEPKGPAFFVTI